MTRARLTALLALLVPLLALGAPASAQALAGVDDVVDELQRDQVAVDPAARIPLDEDAVADAVQTAPVPVYVATVTEQTADQAGGPAQLVLAIGRSLGDTDAVVLVISPGRDGQPFFRADNGRGAGARGIDAGQAVESAIAAGARGEVTEAAVTGVVLDFVDRIDAQAGGGGVGGSGGTGQISGGGTSLLPLLLVGGAGFGAYSLVRRRKGAKARGQELEDLRADVESLYGRLGSDVQLLAPGDDAVARQALADAAERYNATGALMAKADTPGEFAAARRTAVEGLTAARVVRQRLGLDPGPDVPLPPGEGPQLTEVSRVQVGEDVYDGSPEYEPGRPHYYEGGYYGGQPVPGGWYATPFWQTLLIGSMMSGSRGYGGGYSGGYGGYGGGIGGGGFSGGGLGGMLGGGRRRRGGGGGGGFGGFGGGGGWGGGGRRGGGGGGGSW